MCYSVERRLVGEDFSNSLGHDILEGHLTLALGDVREPRLALRDLLDQEAVLVVDDGEVLAELGGERGGLLGRRDAAEIDGDQVGVPLRRRLERAKPDDAVLLESAGDR